MPLGRPVDPEVNITQARSSPPIGTPRLPELWPDTSSGPSVQVVQADGGDIEVSDGPGLHVRWSSLTATGRPHAEGEDRVGWFRPVRPGRSDATSPAAAGPVHRPDGVPTHRG